MSETALTFDCEQEPLLGVLHPASGKRTGVIVVVGGPQYRIGSHRQFVLLARDLAAVGYPVLRFDVRGMGDSGGAPRDFEHIAPDIAAAVECLLQNNPGLEQIVLWGLCDGASASLMYAARDERIRGLVLLNPWVRSQAGIAEAYVKHYYLQRLFSQDFWRTLLSSGPARIATMLRELLRNLRLAARAGAKPQTPEVFTERMRRAAEEFRGAILVVISGNDLTGQEFESHCAHSGSWQSVFKRPTTVQHRLEGADHTFSKKQWRDTVSAWTRQWLDERFADSPPRPPAEPAARSPTDPAPSRPAVSR
jgi:uncharacterized protein